MLLLEDAMGYRAPQAINAWGSVIEIIAPLAQIAPQIYQKCTDATVLIARRAQTANPHFAQELLAAHLCCVHQKRKLFMTNVWEFDVLQTMSAKLLMESNLALRATVVLKLVAPLLPMAIQRGAQEYHALTAANASQIHVFRVNVWKSTFQLLQPLLQKMTPYQSQPRMVTKLIFRSSHRFASTAFPYY